MSHAEPKIPIAVVGAGWVGTARHIPTLLSNPRFHVVGVVDSHPGRAEAAATRFGLRRSATSDTLAGVPWLAEIDAITVATAPMNHAATVRQARGLDIHTLCEKPFTMTTDEAEELARPGGPAVAVMHNFQFARSAQRLWNDLESGALGDVMAVQATQWSNANRRLPAWYEELPLGLFFDESPHLLYLLRRIAPELELTDATVIADQAGRATPSLVWAAYRSANGAGFPLSLSMNFSASVSEWHLAVHGSRAVGVVDLFRDIYVRVKQDGTHGTRDVLRTSVAASVSHWQGFASSGLLHLRRRLWYGVDVVVQRFADAITEGRDAEACGRIDARDVRLLQDQILRAPPATLNS